MSPLRNPTPEGLDPAGRRRADARRNRAALVASATEVFAEQGVAAPLDEVARRAGVGNATMYRHFPTRAELIVAVYADEVRALCTRGEALVGAVDPGEAMFEWLAAFVEHIADKRDLAAVLSAEPVDRRLVLFEQWHGAMHATTTELLDRARQAGAVEGDVEAWDLLALANGIALGAADDDQARRLLAVVRRGVLADRLGGSRIPNLASGREG